MTVNITDPPDNGTFPDGNGWTALATIDSTDGVDGVLMDNDPNNPEGIYPSNGPSYLGQDPGTGLYKWQVPFLVDNTIHNLDPLTVQCYDSETFDEGDTHNDTASEAGLATDGCKKKKPAEPRPTIEIDSATLSGTTVPVTVKLTPKTTGAIFLTLLNYPAGAKKPTSKDVRLFPLLPSNRTIRKHTFHGVDASQWTHIYVIAVIKGHQGHPKRKWLKPLPAK